MRKSQAFYQQSLFAFYLKCLALVAFCSFSEGYCQVADSFDPGLFGLPYTGPIQPDGRVLVGGQLRISPSAPRRSLLRLNADGSLDQTLNPPMNDALNSLAIQS